MAVRELGTDGDHHGRAVSQLVNPYGVQPYWRAARHAHVVEVVLEGSGLFGGARDEEESVTETEHDQGGADRLADSTAADHSDGGLHEATTTTLVDARSHVSFRVASDARSATKEHTGTARSMSARAGDGRGRSAGAER